MNIFLNFFYSKEPFLIHDSILYTIDNIRNYPNKIWINKQEYGIDPVQSLSELSLELGVEKIRKLREKYQEFQSGSFEEFIVTDVFNHFNKESKGIVTLPDKWKNLDVKRVMDDLIADFLGGQNILSIDDLVFSIEKGNKTQNSLRIKNKNYSLKWRGSLQNYVQNISQRLESYVTNLNEDIEMIEEELLDAINHRKDYTNKNKYQVRSIGFKKINKSDYEIYVNVSPFILGHTNQYIYVDSCRAGLIARYENNKVQFMGSAKIFTENHRHPFVSVNSMCFGTQKINNLIKYNHWYNFDRKNLSQIIGDEIFRLQATMEMGYKEEFNKIYHPLTDKNPLVATSYAQALHYGQAIGLKQNRVISMS